MKTIIKVAVIIIIAGISFQSCSRKGCTDSKAFNYDERATQDDCSCFYQGKLMIWFNEETANLFYQHFQTNYFYLYIDNVNVNEFSEFDASETPPDCDKSLNTVNIFLGDKPSKTVIVTFKSPYTSAVIKTVNLTINAGRCNIYELKL